MSVEITKKSLEKMFADLGKTGLVESDGELYLADGNEFGVCTNCARYAVKKLGRGKVMGFDYGYMTSKVPGYSNSDIEAIGGHDFAIIDDRYLVDLWTRFDINPGGGIFDLTDPQDMKAVREFYGDPQHWTIVPDRREDIHSDIQAGTSLPNPPVVEFVGYKPKRSTKYSVVYRRHLKKSPAGLGGTR